MKRLLILILLLCAPRLDAAISVIQTATKAGAATLDSYDLAFTSNVAADSLLVVAGSSWDNGGVSSYTVTDTRGTSYTILSFPSSAGDNGNGLRLFLAYGISPSAGANTVTVNPAGDAANSTNSFGILEASGVDTATPLDVDGGGVEGTSTTPTRDITTGTANALVIGVMTHNTFASPTLTEQDGTLISEEQNGLTFISHNAIYKIEGAAGVDTINWTTSASVVWQVYLASFKEAAAGAPASTSRRIMLRRPS